MHVWVLPRCFYASLGLWLFPSFDETGFRIPLSTQLSANVLTFLQPVSLPHNPTSVLLPTSQISDCSEEEEEDDTSEQRPVYDAAAYIDEKFPSSLGAFYLQHLCNSAERNLIEITTKYIKEKSGVLVRKIRSLIQDFFSLPLFLLFLLLYPDMEARAGWLADLVLGMHAPRASRENVLILTLESQFRVLRRPFISPNPSSAPLEFDLKVTGGGGKSNPV